MSVLLKSMRQSNYVHNMLNITSGTIIMGGSENFGYTEKQKNIEQGSTKLKELHVCIMRVQKRTAAWRLEVP